MASEGRFKEADRVQFPAGSWAAVSPDRRNKGAFVIRAFQDQYGMPRLDVLFDGEAEPVRGYDDASFESAPRRRTTMRFLRLTGTVAQPEREWVDGPPAELAKHAEEALKGFWVLSPGTPEPKPVASGMPPEKVEIVTEGDLLLARYSVYELLGIEYDWVLHDSLPTRP